MKKIKVGLLPLYIKIYDDGNVSRKGLTAFYNKTVDELSKQGFDVLTCDFCRVKNEFDFAVKTFENSGADVLVTLHMAYSPSLESIDALSSTKLPIVVFDSTEAFSLSKEYTDDIIMNNHGIHGVMDMCNLLKQRGKKYSIVAGHFCDDTLIKRLSDFIRAGVCANSLKDIKVGRFGSSFKGMGDFYITKEQIKDYFGVDVIDFTNEQMKTLVDKVSDQEIKAEKAEYFNDYINAVNPDNDHFLNRSIKAGLAVRKGIEEFKLDAFSVNYSDMTDDNLCDMPFVECCKAMGRGVGYAGEGDVLTSAFVGALLKGFKDTSFIEIFCPDWKKDIILISHMGEMNFNVASEKPTLIDGPFVFSDIKHFVKAVSKFKTGKAVFGNVYKDFDGKYKLLFSEVDMVDNNVPMDPAIIGWIKPKMPISNFLEKLSTFGVTHHSFLIYDVEISALEFFGKLLDLEVNIV